MSLISRFVFRPSLRKLARHFAEFTYYGPHMRVLLKIDAALILAFEQVCHRMQQRFSRTNYWLLGKLAIAVSGIFSVELKRATVGRPSLLLLDHFVSRQAWFVLTGLLAVFAGYIGLFYWKQQEVESFARLRRGSPNPAKRNRLHRFTRVWLAGSTAANVPLVAVFGLADVTKYLPVTLYLLILCLLVTSCFLLYACDPMPLTTSPQSGTPETLCTERQF